MQASYTCRQCLGLLRSTIRSGPSPSLARSSTSGTRRCISSTSTTKSPKPAVPASRTKQAAFKTRYASSLHPQGQTPKAASVEIPSPPGLASTPIPETTGRALLQPNNLFHPFSTSPSPEIRQRAAFMKQNAYCPHPDHHLTRLPDTTSPSEKAHSTPPTLPPAHVNFECPDCGIPVYCSEAHWADDYESHLQICDTLREINEDDHDLRSGRFFPEFEYPGPQIEEAMVNMTNWDTYLYSREYRALNDERALRQATRLLTYPVTIASVLHELSPYSIRKGGHLTVEGLKSLSALRYTLHPPRSGSSPDSISGLRPNPPPIRLFILGARAESSLPREVWAQLTHLFPRVAFHLLFIGPESMANRDSEFPLPPRTASNPFGAIVEDRISHQLKISTIVDYYHTLHDAQAFQPFDPYFDCFMLFHPGLGHPASSEEWRTTLPRLLETKVPVICTGYSRADMERDWEWVRGEMGGEVDLLMEPGENRFRSMRWEVDDRATAEVDAGNWGVWGFRGKRYETTRKDVEEGVD